MKKSLIGRPILVLGSNSFSGSSFISQVLSNGKSVIGVSRSSEVTTAFRPYHKLATDENFVFLKIDLNTNPEKIGELVRTYGIEVIVNFVAQSMVAESWEDPDDWYKTNVVSLAQICKNLVGENSIKRFVHFTTPEVYGSTDNWLSETFDFAPSTPYAVSRAAGDWHLRCLFENYGFPVIFTRAANVYGPGQQVFRIIPKTIVSALSGKQLPLHGGGKSIRSFVHIRDVARALELIYEKGTIGATYHISTNDMTSIFDLVQSLSRLLGVSIEDLIQVMPERAGKDFAYRLSSEKIRHELGWEDHITLQEGLIDTLDWVRQYFTEIRNVPANYEHKR